MPNGRLSRETRLQIMLAPEELEAVDDFRFKNAAPPLSASFSGLVWQILRRRALLMVNNRAGTACSLTTAKTTIT
jgi:hypothetical protein